MISLQQIPSGFVELTECINASAMPISCTPTSHGWNNNSGTANLSLFILIIWEIVKHCFTLIYIIATSCKKLKAILSSIGKKNIGNIITKTIIVAIQLKQGV
jgi:hypothetical protein